MNGVCTLFVQSVDGRENGRGVILKEINWKFIANLFRDGSSDNGSYRGDQFSLVSIVHGGWDFTFLADGPIRIGIRKCTCESCKPLFLVAGRQFLKIDRYQYFNIVGLDRVCVCNGYHGCENRSLCVWGIVYMVWSVKFGCSPQWLPHIGHVSVVACASVAFGPIVVVVLVNVGVFEIRSERIDGS